MKKLKVTEILANQPTDLSHETRHGQLVMKEIQYCCNEPVSMKKLQYCYNEPVSMKNISLLQSSKRIPAEKIENMLAAMKKCPHP